MTSQSETVEKPIAIEEVTKAVETRAQKKRREKAAFMASLGMCRVEEVAVRLAAMEEAREAGRSRSTRAATGWVLGWLARGIYALGWSLGLNQNGGENGRSKGDPVN